VKKRSFKGFFALLLTVSLIVGSSLGIQLLNGHAQGLCGDPNPTISCNLVSLTGNYFNTYAYQSTWGVSSIGYPRLITNGNQIRAKVWAYDTEGISSLEVKFVKNTNTDPARIWEVGGSNVEELYSQTYSPYINEDEKIFVFSLTPGRYILTTKATTTDGRVTYKNRYVEYGTGNVIATDFAMSYRENSVGRERFCALYDLTGQGINTSSGSLFMTRIGHNPPFNYQATDLSIVQSSSSSRRYLVTGTVAPRAFSYLPGTYVTWLNVQHNGNYVTLYYPDFTI